MGKFKTVTSFKTRVAKISLFDKSLIALFVILGIVFIYLFFRKSTYLTVIVKVGEDNVLWERLSRPWYSSNFYEGMAESDGLGRINAVVEDVRSFDIAPSNTLFSNSMNNLYSVKKAVYLTIKLKVVHSRSNNQYTYKGLPVLIGSSINLYLDKAYVSGLITAIEGAKDQRSQQTLIIEAKLKGENQTYLETSGVDIHIADAVSVGQKILDDQGRVVIEILGKKVEDAKRLTVTSSGNTIVTTNPLRKDVSLNLKVNALKLQDKYYLFDDVPLLVGYPIPINSPTTSLLPEVTKITVQ